MPTRSRPFAALRLIVEPIPAEKRRLLGERWSSLDPEIRTPLQGLGRQTTGCGATIGLMPRCDFDCEGCYLGGEANAIPRATLAAGFEQLATLRRWLGPKGNVQLTDGELTLLPEDELVALVREARRLGTTPMLMSHGDTFRRKPKLLQRLVREGGLREVSIHVDSLQRGRRGPLGSARSEAELMPMRTEFAEQIREVRQETGIRLRAATTLTIARQNLDEVPEVVDWCFHHRDVFGLVSFQPLAQVGRTRDHLEGVEPDELWLRIGSALAAYGYRSGNRSPLQLGHPDCTRLEPFLVFEREGEAPRLLPIVRAGHPEDAELAHLFLELGLGGLNFRDDSPFERTCRSLGVLAAAPGFVLGRLRRWAGERAAEVGSSLARLFVDGARKRIRFDSFQVVSHHFMSGKELATERGRERLAACVFRVPLGGRMVSMCEANALGGREQFYAELRGQRRGISAGTRLR